MCGIQNTKLTLHTQDQQMAPLPLKLRFEETSGLLVRGLPDAYHPSYSSDRLLT